MTSPALADKLRELIALNGPMSVADYMAHCLGDPEHGYYITRDPLGAAGDFTTAPEISQLFGEIVGAWLVHAWRLAGAPSPVRLVELGPGRGTLMADILRVVARARDLWAGLSVHLVETSPVLRDRQVETLRNTGVDVAWHERLDQVPDGPLLLVANEFFDALPIRQFMRVDGNWCERVVGVGENGALAFGIGAGSLAEGPPAPDGSILEVSPAREAVMVEIGARIAGQGVAALIVDYGHAETAPGDTLQAMRRHAFVDPLAEPGEADLTSHVDFGVLRRAALAQGAAVHGPVTQGEFLLSLGLLERAGQLGARADEWRREAIRSDVERLAGPEQMGTLFKVLAVTSPGLAPPPFLVSRR